MVRNLDRSDHTKIDRRRVVGLSRKAHTMRRHRTLTDIKLGNPAFREEFFGPVALFFRVRNEDEVIALANDSNFGLGGSVFTRDVARDKRVASRIDTGMVFVNHPT